MHVMYGLLLPAVGGTVFWWLIQHVQGGRAIEIVTSSVIVYYLCLHFVAGQQIDSTHYGKVGFLLDLVVIVAIEGLFFSVDAAHKHLEMGMVALLAILVVLFLWNIKTSKSSGLSDSFNHVVLAGAALAVGAVWGLTYALHDLSESHAILISALGLAVTSTVHFGRRQGWVDGDI